MISVISDAGGAEFFIEPRPVVEGHNTPPEGSACAHSPVTAMRPNITIISA